MLNGVAPKCDSSLEALYLDNTAKWVLSLKLLNLPISRVQDMSWRGFKDVLSVKNFYIARCFADICKTSWERLENALVNDK